MGNRTEAIQFFCNENRIIIRNIPKPEETHSNLWQVRNSKQETNRVKYVRFAAAIQTSDSVKLWIEPGNSRSLSVRFKAIYHDLFDVHFEKRTWLQNNIS